MKTFKFTIFTVLMSVFSLNLSAQRYGSDSIQCTMNIHLYQPEYKSGNYDAALPLWREVLKNCPIASQNTYGYGMVMMRYLIGKTTDPTLKNARIDSLLMLYDKLLFYGKTVPYFKIPSRAKLLYNKAIDVENYRPDSHKDIYAAYKAAIDEDKSINLMAAAKVMLSARELFEKKELSLEEFTNIYTEMADVAEFQVKAAPDDTVKSSLKAAVESAFLTTDAANCENLVKVLGERFNANKENAEVVRMVINLLQLKECTDTALYYESAEAYNKLNPSPSASYALARVYYSKKDKGKALQFFKEATETETNAENKSKYFCEFGSLILKEGNITEAISYARKAIAANQRNGKAYLLLGTAYKDLPRCGEDEVSKRAIYWVAVDQFARAKQLDSSLASEANKLINVCSQYFPSTIEAFYIDLQDGNEYTIPCGPLSNMKTIVRTNK